MGLSGLQLFSAGSFAKRSVSGRGAQGVPAFGGVYDV